MAQSLLGSPILVGPPFKSVPLLCDGPPILVSLPLLGTPPFMSRPSNNRIPIISGPTHIGEAIINRESPNSEGLPIIGSPTNYRVAILLLIGYLFRGGHPIFDRLTSLGGRPLLRLVYQIGVAPFERIILLGGRPPS